MNYDVIAAELRAAATEHRRIATSLGATPVDVTATTPEPVGHVELAAWLSAVEEQCHNAHQALGDGLEGLAEDLDVQAADYETTDETVGVWFQQPYYSSPLLDPLLGPGVTPMPGPAAGPAAPQEGTP